MGFQSVYVIQQLAASGSAAVDTGDGCTSDNGVTDRENVTRFRHTLRRELSQYLPGRDYAGDLAASQTCTQAAKRALLHVRPCVLRGRLNDVIWAEASRFEREWRERELNRQKRAQEQRDRDARLKAEAHQRWWARTPQERRLWYVNQIKVPTDYLSHPAVVVSTLRTEMRRLHPADRALLETDPRRLARWINAFTDAYGYFLEMRLAKYAAADDRLGAYRLVAEAYAAILTIDLSNLREEFWDEARWVVKRRGPSSERWAQLRSRAEPTKRDMN
jgi:hypothetical protein